MSGVKLILPAFQKLGQKNYNDKSPCAGLPVFTRILVFFFLAKAIYEAIIDGNKENLFF